MPWMFCHQKYSEMMMAKTGGEGVIRNRDVVADVVEGVGEQSGKVQAGGHSADGAGQDVVEQQRRDGELSQLAAHGLLDHAIDAAANEHRAGFDVDGADGIAEQHDRQHEPGSALADNLLGVAADVVRRRREVGENDGRRPPERDERQHDRRSDEDFNCRPLQVLDL